MRRRVAPEHFQRAAELMKSPRTGIWWVCNEYEYRGGDIVAKLPLHVPSGEGWRLSDRTMWRGYSPLEETPDLFLKFARLHKAPDFMAAAIDWSVRYGVPGGDSSGRLSRSREDIMPLAWFSEEAKRAWVILTMYEAALNSDPRPIRFLLSEYRNETLELWPLEILREDDDEGCLELALLGSMHIVDYTTRRLCFPSLSIRPEGHYLDPTQVETTWLFTNLLGALYLQMYWLMASGGYLARCENCGQAISLARTYPEGRKRRRDTRFCSDACRQANHRSKKRS